MAGREDKNTEKEDRILAATLQDKARQSEDRYMATNSHFLDLRQRSVAAQASKGFGGITCAFYGGYDDAERVVEIFFPEGLLMAECVEEHFRLYPEDNPLTVIRASLKKGAPRLSHRDYLGALMGLGIRREMTGDILVREDGADLIVLKDIAEFLLLNYKKAGRSYLTLSQVPMEELIYDGGKKLECMESVASLRLDNIVSAAFGLSRSKASEAIASGIIFVGGINEKKPDRPVEEGEKIVFRGKGKVVLRSVGGTSSKGRIRIVLEKYV